MIYQSIVNLACRIKRRTQGRKYALEVYDIIAASADKVDFPQLENNIYINLSFDLELGFNGNFYRNQFKNAIKKGAEALDNIKPICNYLEDSQIEYNVQIVGQLLTNNLSDHIFSSEQIGVIKKHPEIFSLDHLTCQNLSNSLVELGSHGFSHRIFKDLSREEANWELDKVIDIFEKRFKKRPVFMSFPKNKLAYVDLLLEKGIPYYRSIEQFMSLDKGGMPLGMMLSSITITPRELDKILKIIKQNQQPFLLHLWSHFTEMSVEKFDQYIKVMKNNGCLFTTTSSYLKKINNQI